MINNVDIIFYIEFDRQDENASSNSVCYKFPFVPRIGEDVYFDHSTYEKFENDYTVSYLEKTNTKLRHYSRVINVYYEIDSQTIFVVLGLNPNVINR